MEWISSFFYFITDFIPRLLHVTEDMLGVKMHGATHKVLKPGYHIYLPIIHSIRTGYITRQELDLPDQLLQSVDGHAMLVSASIVYRISDIVEALIKTQDYESTVIEATQRAIKSFVSINTLNTVTSDHNGDKLLELTQKIVNEYGLIVESVFITSAGKTKSYHITGIYK
jgi:regulator of protease activity HflC (stomatin/prohibitin superfamily)